MLEKQISIPEGFWRCTTNGRLHANGTSCYPEKCSQELTTEFEGNSTVSAPTLKKPVLAVIDNEVAMEALNDNIIILEDPFRTGFECKGCDGEGHTQELCKACLGNKVVAINKDFNAGAATLTEEDKKALPPHFVAMLERKAKEQKEEKIVSGGLEPCQKCICFDKQGRAYISGFIQCEICKGRGASMIVPEESMRRPTSGLVKSLGPLCRFLQAGDRVVYSNMIGHTINYRHNVVFRTMREDEIMMRLHGTNPEKFQRKLS